MSKKGDFLSGFSGGNTQKPLTEQNASPVKETNPTEEKKIDVKNDTSSKTDLTENKKLADKIVAEAEKKGNTPTRSATSGAATRPTQSANAIIKAPAHVVTKDEKFHQRKMIKYAIIGIASVVVVALIIFLYIMITRVTVPNWVGREIEYAERWGMLDGGTVERDYEYDLEYGEGFVIAQNREPGSTMSRNAVIILTVSRGPDMNEIIPLPDFEAMTRAQIRTWHQDNRVNGVSFTEQASADVDVNHVISVEFPGAADPERFRRSDTIRIVVSTGPETVTIPDLRGRDREAVDEFIENNASIIVEFEYEAHETIARGTVIRQSHAPQTRLEVGDTLTLTLSGGNPVTVPNFANIRRVDALAMAEDHESNLNVNVERRWHGSVPYGRFVSQSVAAGEELFGDAVVTVVYSEGRPWIDRMIDRFAYTIEPAIVLLNDQGASITVDINWVDSWEPRGTVISQSHYSQHVALNQHIVFRISRGNRQQPPGAVQPDPPPPPGDDGGEDFGQ